MKYILSTFLLCLLICCSPKNIYYNTHLSDLPYNVYFEAQHQYSAYAVKGENMIGINTFYAVLPDSLGGAYTTGDCVVEVQRDKVKKQTKDIRLIGITIYNKQLNRISGFDRYHQTFKRVQYKPSDSARIYIPFIKNIVEGWTFERINPTSKSKHFAYCKIFFVTPIK